MKGRVRSYTRVAQRIRQCVRHSSGLVLHTIGEVFSPSARYPLFQVIFTAPREESSQRVTLCLSGGIHGDEPAGVEALLHLMESIDKRRDELSGCTVTIFPCNNPYGYEQNTRENAQGLDLNRQYRKRRPPTEVALIRKALKGRRFDLSVDFHEDVDTDGFYLYELSRDGHFFGETIVKTLSSFSPLNFREEIEGMKASNGIIRPQLLFPDYVQRIKARREWPQALYLFFHGTQHCITCETPVALPMKARVDMHLVALTTAVRELKKTIKTETDHGRGVTRSQRPPGG